MEHVAEEFSAFREFSHLITLPPTPAPQVNKDFKLAFWNNAFHGWGKYLNAPDL
jgi:hypothetical protein